MATRSYDLHPREATVYRFPTAAVRARARRRAIARRLRVGAIVAVAAVALTFARGPDGSATASGRPVPRSVVVEPGDSLWDVAARYAPRSIDRRAYVDALIQLNRLDSPSISSGRRLRLPR